MTVIDAYYYKVYKKATAESVQLIIATELGFLLLKGER